MVTQACVSCISTDSCADQGEGVGNYECPYEVVETEDNLAHSLIVAQARCYDDSTNELMLLIFHLYMITMFYIMAVARIKLHRMGFVAVRRRYMCRNGCGKG